MDHLELPENTRHAIEQYISEQIRQLEASYKAGLAQKDDEIACLKQQIAWFKKVLFGSRSEKLSYVDASQKSLFPEDNVEAKEVSGEEKSEPAKVQVPAHDRKPKRSHKEIFDGLPVVNEFLDLPEDQKVDANGNPLEFVGQTLLRSEIWREPAKIYRKDIYIRAYKKADSTSEEEKICKPDVPAPLIEHSYASASFVSYIIANKYISGMPLYRQEKIFKQQGLTIPRTTMANWVVTVNELYLKKIYDLLHKLLLKQNVIHVDETTFQVLNEPGRKPQQRSYMWVYATSKRAEIQIRCFSYECTRSGQCPSAFLQGYKGLILTDGYSAYNQVSASKGGCWAHMRRKWIEAMPDFDTDANSIAAKGLDFCSRLFLFERSVEHLSDKERARARMGIISATKTISPNSPQIQSAKDILDEYWTWIDSLGTTDGKLKKAVTYAKNQRPFLEKFLTHGEIEISNNQVENAIRPFVVGRKGWLFADSVDGAKASAIIYSLVETAKANHIKAADWLEHVLSVLPERFAYDPNDDLTDLLPWSDGMQSKFKTNL